MASAFNRFGGLAVRHSFRTRPQFLSRPSPHPAFLHQTVVRRDTDSGGKTRRSAPAQPVEAEASKPVEEQRQLEDEIVDYGELAEGSDPFWGFPDSMTVGERQRIKSEMEQLLENPPEDKKKQVQEFKRQVAALEQKYIRQFEMQDPEEPYQAEPKFKPGLLSMGDEMPEEEGEDPEFEGDDISSQAHGELEQHRELREYMRIAAWEMPLLYKHAKKYEPPSAEAPLRFRHTTYMGETHPAQHKIVLEFCTADLPLTNAQRLKLIKLVGQRYDPRYDLVKMSCEMFDTPAQNKRFLGDLVDTLLLEAKNESSAEGGKDKFEDIAPDFRHVKWKPRYAFPNAWKLTPERRQALQAERQQRTLAEQERKSEGRLVVGPEVIDRAVRKLSETRQAQLEMQRPGVRLTR